MDRRLRREAIAKKRRHVRVIRKRQIKGGVALHRATHLRLRRKNHVTI